MRKLVLAACVLAILTGSAAAKTEVVRLADVPAEVVRSAGKAAPDVEWLAAARTGEVSEGEGVRYHLLGKEKKGKKRKVFFVARADGTRPVVMIPLPLGEVPAKALDGLKKARPDFQPTGAQQAGRSVGELITYRISGKQGDDEAVYHVTPDGKASFRE
jgi:hypothetical protein